MQAAVAVTLWISIREVPGYNSVDLDQIFILAGK